MSIYLLKQKMSQRCDFRRVGGHNVTAVIRSCKDLAYSRDDHLFCPGCSEILHYIIVEEDASNIVYELQMSFIKNTVCFNNDRLMCPQCYRTFRATLNEKI